MISMKIGNQIITLLVIVAFLFAYAHASSTNGTDESEDRAFKSNEIGKLMLLFKDEKTQLVIFYFDFGL